VRNILGSSANRDHEESVVNGNGTTMHADEATRMAAVATDAADAADKAESDATAAAAASAASAHAAAATANSAANGARALHKATAKAARRAKAKANRKAEATAQALAARTAQAAKPSPKVWASTIGGAVAFIFWTVATATFWKNTFSADTLAALIGSTTTLVAAAAAYLTADPLRS
jgi:hypothetical protein